jgi:predicted CXXCH cytochrome family protein
MKNKAHRRMTKPLLISGLILLLTGIFMLAGNAGVMAQAQTDEADYIGVRECRSCHRDLGQGYRESSHALALQEVGDDKTLILGDFSLGQEIRRMQFPGESETRPLSVNDIRYVVGSGRHVQRYLYALDDGTLMVLPVEWNALEQVWQPYTLGDVWPSEAYDWNFNCAGCHATGLDVETMQWEDDGVQCESCHGPGSAHAEAVDEAGRTPSDEELERIHTTIVTSVDAQVCGQCHSQGQMPDDHRPFPVDYQPGDDLAASGYSLVEHADDAFWWASGHAERSNMQFNEWLTTGHASALTTMQASDYAEDSCLACHSGDSGDGVTLETAQFGITCATCHAPHGDSAFDFMLVAAPDQLCQSCHTDQNRPDGDIHTPVVEIYEGQTLIDNVPGVASTHFTEGVECVTCHMPPVLVAAETPYSASHTMMPAISEDLEDGQPDSCMSCHSDLSRDYLVGFVDEAQTKVKGRLDTIGQAMTTQNEVPDWVTTAVSAVEKDGSFGFHNYRYTTSLLDAVETQLGIVERGVLAHIPVMAIEDPADCAECHEDEHRQWQLSPHANASLSQTFLETYTSRGQPDYCMTCHASGYDPATQEYVFDGVVCSNCHFSTSMAEHPPGPVEVANDSEICGRCHSGEHAPAYNEWLVSDHSVAGVDCADCHTAHNNGLKLGDVNSTCGDCHQEALVDEVHMGQDMTCVDCHMSKRETVDGEHILQTSHTMFTDTATCAECHGDTHLLALDVSQMPSDEQHLVADLETEVAQLEEAASMNLQSGIVGGAIGALLLVLIVFVAIRLGRVR